MFILHLSVSVAVRVGERGEQLQLNNKVDKQYKLSDFSVAYLLLDILVHDQKDIWERRKEGIEKEASVST